MKIIVRTEGYNSEGAGVCRHEKKTVFLPFSVAGELSEAEIMKRHKSYDEAQIVSIIETSEERRNPPCTVYGICGGCQLMHMTYKEQLIFKKQKLENALKRIGDIHSCVNDVIGSNEEYGYRNTGKYSFDGKSMGFNKRNSHEVMEADRCFLLPEDVEHIKRELKVLMRKDDIYGAVVRRSAATGEKAVILMSDRTSADKRLLQGIRDISSEISCIYLSGNRAEVPISLYGKGYIEERLSKYCFRIKSDSFFQVNTKQAEVLYDVILDHAGLTGKEVVLDLYCGVGSIAICLAEKAGKVTGIDSNKGSISAAIKNAEINRTANAEFIAGKAEDILPSLEIDPDVVILDPPRSGCAPVVIDAVADKSPDKIIYVSCEPSTMPRDIKIFTEKGYTCMEIKAVDMFPQTSHVECCCLLSRTKI